MKKIITIFGIMMLLMMAVASASAPDIQNLTYVQSKTVPYETEGISANTVGTHLYTYTNTDDVARHYIMFDGDASTLTYVNGFGTSDNGGRDIVVSPDGTKVYTLNAVGYVRQYNLGTPYNFSTASLYHQLNYIGDSVNLFTISQNGENMYLVRNNEVIEQWKLATPWDLATGSQNVSSASLTLIENSWSDIELTSDGKHFLIAGSTSDSVKLLNLTTPFDATTVIDTGISYYFGAQAPTPNSMTYSPEANRLYIGDSGVINEYAFPIKCYQCSNEEINNTYFPINCETGWTTNQSSLNCEIPSSGSKTRYLVDGEGNIVGVSQNGQITLLKTTEEKTAPLLSIAGGEKFDIKTWFNNIVTDVKGWLIK